MIVCRRQTHITGYLTATNHIPPQMSWMSTWSGACIVLLNVMICEDCHDLTLQVWALVITQA